MPKLRMLAGISVILLALIVAPGTFAQLPTGTILGVVKDSSGSVVPDATVTIRNVDTNATRTATTSDDGAFRVTALPVGHYSVRTEKSGFKSETQTGLSLEVDQDLVVNTALEVGSATQEVTVTGEAPVVNTTESSLGTVINEEKVADLPLNGRNWVDLAIMQPGISQHKNISGGTPTGAPGESFSANGAPIRSNNYMLDGAMMTTFNGATSASISGTSLGVDAIREFKVETNTFSAEYGLRMGSQATLVTKSGTNAFHGTAFEYLRNDQLDAANFFDSPADTPAGKRLPPFKRNQFGGAIGGPIRKNKTFFFADFEGLQVRQGLTQIGTGIAANCRTQTANPCASNPSSATIVPTIGTTYTTGNVSPLIFPILQFFPVPTPGLPSNEYTYPFTKSASEQYGLIRFDENFSDKDAAFVRFNIDRDRAVQPPTNDPSPEAFDTPFSEGIFATASENHIFSPTLLNDARFSYARTPVGYNENTPPYPGGGTFIPGQLLNQMGGVTPGSGITALPSGSVVTQNQTLLIWSDDIFITHGRHALKFGTLITHADQGAFLGTNNKGSMTYSSEANFLEGNYTSYTALTPGSTVFRNYTSGTLGFYVQDDIRVTSRWTVNAGLRWEAWLPILSETQGLGAALRNPVTDSATTPGPPVRNPSLRAFSPRGGFAWDIFGNGKTALRGGAGILYDIGNIGATLGQGAGGTPVGTTGLGSTITTVTSGVASSTCTSPALTIPFALPSCFLGTTLQLPDYNIKQPTLYVGNLTFEQQLPGNVGLSIGWAGSRGEHLFNRIEGDGCIPEAVVNGLPNWVNAANKECPLGRVNPHWSEIILATTNADSWYNALQVVATKRTSHGLQFQGNYTFSKLLDDGNGQLPADNATATIAPGFPLLDKGPAGFDITQNFRFNVIYHLPQTSRTGFLGEMANGWWVSSIVSYQTGYPFSVWESVNRSLSGELANSADRLNVNPGRNPSNITSGGSTGCTIGTTTIPQGAALGTVQMWYDPCAFSVQATGNLGNEPRNYLRGPHLSNVDFSAVKDTALKFLGEGGLLEFRAEFFNIFNHPNLGMPEATNGVATAYTLGSVAAATSSLTTGAGTITNTLGSTSRQIQVSLRVSF